MYIDINEYVRQETMIKCTDYDTYSRTKDPSPFLLVIIQTHQLASTEGPLVDEAAAKSWRIYE